MKIGKTVGLPGVSLDNTFSALQYRNYRLWFIGQLASLVGTWMQTTAEGFLIFQLTHSPAYLGYIGFASGIPTWLLMWYGGVVSDWMPRRNLLVITQTVMMILAFVLAALTYAGIVRPWQIVALASLLGIANAFDAPARQAFVADLVEREDLTNAIALNSTMFQLATVVGPAVAGVTYMAFGPAWCFTINSVSFTAVIAALLLMQIKPRLARSRASSAGHEIAEGLRYAMHHPTLRALIILMSVIGLLGTGHITLFPDWAVEVLHGDATTNGWLQSARGAGALVAALTIAVLGRFQWRGRLLTLGTFFFPLALIGFATMTSLPFALAVLVLVGWGFMIVTNMAGTLVQMLTPEDLRGRVTGIYLMVLFGSVPIGALVAGAVAERIGAPLTVFLGAIVLLLFASGVYIFVPRLRGVE